MTNQTKYRIRVISLLFLVFVVLPLILPCQVSFPTSAP